MNSLHLTVFYLNFQNVPHEIHENLISLNEILEVSFFIQKNELFNSSFFYVIKKNLSIWLWTGR